MKNNRKLRAFSLIEISIVILIIGILIAGITQSSRLVTQAKVNTAKSMTQASPVPSIPGLHFWSESADLNNFQSNIDDGDEILTWKDINSQSGSRSNLSGTSGTTPTYVFDGINGIPAASFSAADQFVSTSNLTDITTGKATVFAVVKTGTTVADAQIFAKGTNFGLNSEATNSYGWQFTGGGNDHNSDEATSVATPYVVSVVYNDASDASGSGTATGYTIYQDGVNQVNANTGGTLATPGSDFVIGASSGGFIGYVGEVIVYDRSLKKEERQTVEEYLGKKWDIDITVASY